jgi:WD40 repeat protein
MSTKITVLLKNTFTGHKQSVYCMCLDGKGGFFSAGSDGFIVHWESPDMTTGVLFAQIPEAIYSVAYLPHSDTILAGTQFGQLYFLQKKSSPKIVKIATHGIVWILPVPGGDIFVLLGDGQLCVITENGHIQKMVQFSIKSLRYAALTEKGNVLICGSEGVVWEMDTALNILQKHKIDDSSIFRVLEWNKQWIYAGRSAKIVQWNTANAEKKVTDAHWFTIHALSVSPNGKWLGTGSMDKTIRLWDEQLNLLKVIDLAKMQGHKSSVNEILWLNNQVFVSCSDDALIKCWKVESEEPEI